MIYLTIAWILLTIPVSVLLTACLYYSSGETQASMTKSKKAKREVFEIGLINAGIWWAIYFLLLWFFN